MRRVVITGIGIVSPNGNNAAEVEPCLSNLLPTVARRRLRDIRSLPSPQDRPHRPQ